MITMGKPVMKWLFSKLVYTVKKKKFKPCCRRRSLVNNRDIFSYCDWLPVYTNPTYGSAQLRVAVSYVWSRRKQQEEQWTIYKTKKLVAPVCTMRLCESGIVLKCTLAENNFLARSLRSDRVAISRKKNSYYSFVKGFVCKTWYIPYGYRI